MPNVRATNVAANSHMATAVSGVQKTNRASRCRMMNGAALVQFISQEVWGAAWTPGPNAGLRVLAASAERLSDIIGSPCTGGSSFKGERDQGLLPRATMGLLALRMALC